MLLILAGITISLVLGDNGIINHSKQSGEEYTKASLKEEIELAISDIEMKALSNHESLSIEKVVAELPNILPISIEQDGDEAIGDYKDYGYIIDNNYQVTIEDKDKDRIKPKVTLELLPRGTTFTNTEEIKLTASIKEGTIVEIKKPDGTIVQNVDTLTYPVTANGKYTFSVTGSNGNTTIKTITINSILSNLNLEKKSYSADGYSGSNVPENAINGSMQNGNGLNWYGGTKLLIEYSNLSSIEAIGVYTTGNWGYAFSPATIYYTEDDSLTLTSDLTNVQSVTVTTESDQVLSQPIKAKRVMLVKDTVHAVYEFTCFGKPI